MVDSNKVQQTKPNDNDLHNDIVDDGIQRLRRYRPIPSSTISLRKSLSCGRYKVQPNSHLQGRVWPVNVWSTSCVKKHKVQSSSCLQECIIMTKFSQQQPPRKYQICFSNDHTNSDNILFRSVSFYRPFK